MSEQIRIEISVNSRFSPISMLRMTSFIGAVFAPGILLDSQAMQWLGFLMCIICAIGFAIDIQRQNQRLSIDQARKRLDEIEANSNQPT